MAPQVGLEPTTDRLTADCSTTELLWNNMGLSGLEPPTSRLSGVRSNQLSYRPTVKERVMRIELTTSAWKAEVLPLNYTRILLSSCLKIFSRPIMSFPLLVFHRRKCVKTTRRLFIDVVLVAEVLPLNYTRMVLNSLIKRKWRA